MTKLISQLHPGSSEFKQNESAMLTLVNKLQDTIKTIALGGDESARQRHLKHGKLLPRERLARLIDPGSPFLELSQMAALDVYEDYVPAAGIITGIGRI